MLSFLGIVLGIVVGGVLFYMFRPEINALIARARDLFIKKGN